MQPVATRLPAALGSGAALVVAILSFTARVSPMACATRAIAAYVVFASFGIVIRYLLADAAGSVIRSGSTKSNDGANDAQGMAELSGRSVSDALHSTEHS